MAEPPITKVAVALSTDDEFDAWVARLRVGARVICNRGVPRDEFARDWQPGFFHGPQPEGKLLVQLEDSMWIRFPADKVRLMLRQPGPPKCPLSEDRIDDMLHHYGWFGTDIRTLLI